MCGILFEHINYQKLAKEMCGGFALMHLCRNLFNMDGEKLQGHDSRLPA